MGTPHDDSVKRQPIHANTLLCGPFVILYGEPHTHIIALGGALADI